MKRFATIAGTVLILSVTAFAAVSIVEGAPIVLDKIDYGVSSYFAARLERLNANKLPEQTPQEYALNDVMIRATQLCDDHLNVCNDMVKKGAR